MSMPIGTIDHLVAAIQAQLSARTPNTAVSKAAGSAGKAAGSPVRATRKVAAGRYAQKNLAGLIELRINRIASDDPQRGRKAFRVFLEAVLLSQLGESLVNDAKFFQMVDDVQCALEADAACGAMVASAIAQLLDPAP